MAAIRNDLASALEETLKLAGRLAEDARDTGIPVAELVAQATMLDRLDQRREALIEQLRRTASAGLRATQPGPPIREVILAALDELGWPQNAGFLEDYLWAKRQLQFDSRAFASLRRDESRSWRRSPGARSAYIVPALNPDGTANPRWLTSSAWGLSRRVIASTETERLFDLQKIHALHVRGSRGPLGTLLERNVQEVIAIEPPPVSASAAATRAWRGQVRSHTEALIEAIRARDDGNRERLAERLSSLTDHDRLWGRDVQGLRATPAQAIESTRR
ncbi:MAG: hypothetical protein ACRDNS_31505 [Trebonia sp.]